MHDPIYTRIKVSLFSYHIRDIIVNIDGLQSNPIRVSLADFNFTKNRNGEMLSHCHYVTVETMSD